MTQAQIDAFLNTFTLTSTGSASDVGSSDIRRKTLADYVKQGTDSYEMLGYKEEEMSTASNYDTESMEDVTGVKYNDVINKNETLTMDGYRLNPVKTKFMEKAIKLKISDQEDKMNNYTILHIYGFLRDSQGRCLAIEESDCSMTLDNAGGQGFVTHDVSFNLSGKKKYGTVNEIVETPTFAEYTPSV